MNLIYHKSNNTLDILNSAWDHIDNFIKQPKIFIQSESSTLEDLIKNYYPGQLTVLAGNEESAVDQLTFNILKDALLENKIRVLYFSLRSPSSTSMIWLICSIAQVSIKRLYDGFVSIDEMERMDQAKEKIKESYILFDDLNGFTLDGIKGIARNEQSKGNLDFIFIDSYLNIIDSNSTGKLHNVSYTLKKLAQELQVPILLNYELESYPSFSDEDQNTPILGEDKKNSILPHSDLEIVLHRNPRKTTDSYKNGMQATVSKNHMGHVGSVNVSNYLKITH